MAIKTERASIVGSLISGFMASICCIGPVAFALLGVSGAGFISAFEKYRPIFTVVTVLFLGTAFYFTYKKKPAEECEEGTYCANPKSDKWNKIILWASTVLVVFFLFFPWISGFIF